MSDEIINRRMEKQNPLCKRSSNVNEMLTKFQICDLLRCAVLGGLGRPVGAEDVVDASLRHLRERVQLGFDLKAKRVQVAA